MAFLTLESCMNVLTVDKLTIELSRKAVPKDLGFRMGKV